MVDSIDSPQGDHVDRTAAATPTRSARAISRKDRDDVMWLLGVGTAATDGDQDGVRRGGDTAHPAGLRVAVTAGDP